MEMAANLSVTFDETKDIEESGIADELITRGGKRQVPYLVDSDRDVAMYESNDIIDYLREHYAGTATDTDKKPKIHNAGAGATCVACEG
jgi:glutathione S-transferase